MLYGRIALLVLASFLLLPLEAAGQNRSDRYLIRVYDDGGTCRYQIQNHANQDLFNIRPAGTLTVASKGNLWVDVTVQDDPRGTPGTRSQRSIAVREQNGKGMVTARSAIGRSTEHKVQIQCCLVRGSRNECPKWTDALPPDTSMGWMPSVPEGMPSSGPSATEPLDPPQPPGGPVMRVDEN
ncbi:hypothetical protein CRI94_16845 [Longibacter salinarum]|uniref:Uncharacterized protein n=1 Tax=Longibacter salinarum TaxID=1850348 RepID=A0A2A8CTR5_9BACT|nr:hypothetical protein [Longibacter salinarum]PEN11088.1 hypothetical protein CRI94_16845 [Longibacter salinarum]